MGGGKQQPAPQVMAPPPPPPPQQDTMEEIMPMMMQMMQMMGQMATMRPPSVPSMPATNSLDTPDWDAKRAEFEATVQKDIAARKARGVAGTVLTSPLDWSEDSGYPVLISTLGGGGVPA